MRRFCFESLQSRLLLAVDFAVHELLSSDADVDGTRSIVAADLDGDGDQDVASASEDDGKVAWYENVQHGSFAPQRVVDVAEGVNGLVAADFDQDSDPDLISITSVGRLAFHENQEGLEFAPARLLDDSIAAYASIEATDLDGDDLVDIVVATFESAGWYRNLGQGQFGDYVEVGVLNSVRIVRAADVNGDSVPDLVVGTRPDLVWLRGNGNGEFDENETSIASGTFAAFDALQLADIDGDNDIDIITGAGTTAFVYSNNGEGIFQQSWNGTPEARFEVFSLAMWDVDLDEVNDLVIGTREPPNPQFPDFVGGGIFWAAGQGDGTFSNIDGLLRGVNSGYLVETGDVLGDEAPELLFGGDTFAGDSIKFVGSEDFGRFPGGISLGAAGSRPIATRFDGVTEAIALDMDNDGDLDSVAGSRSDGRVFYHENQGDDGFGELRPISSEGRINAMAARQLDDDEFTDLVVGGERGVVAFLSESSPFDRRIALSSLIADYIDSIDHDGDGDEDLLLLGREPAGDRQLWVLPNLGTNDSLFGDPVVLVDDAEDLFDRPAIVDFDQDGDLDILTGTQQWLENVEGVFQQRGVDTLQSGRFIRDVLNAGDIDGDGDMDVLYANQVFTNNGGSLANHLTFDTLGIGERFSAEIISKLSDLDGDGDLDVVSLLADSTVGNGVVAWFENDGVGDFSALQQIAETSLRTPARLTLYVADFDQDGDVDILAGGQVFTFNGNPGQLLFLENLTSQPLIPGDLNDDGVVDFSDFLQLSANFGKTEAERADGDVDGDGVVDFSDFLLLSNNFGIGGA